MAALDIPPLFTFGRGWIQLQQRSKFYPISYSTDPQGCTVAVCTNGKMFSVGQPVQTAICANGGYLTNGDIVNQVACGLPCTTCTALPQDGLTCPAGLTCTTVSQRAGQCSEAYCPTGVMTADGTTVDFLTCNGQGKWVDAAGTAYTAAQCEMSCELCTALTNAGMPCPTGLICEATMEREGQCKETYCATGTMTGNTQRTTVTSLTCNGLSQWVDPQNAIYASAQCEIPCDQCTALTNTGMTCPTGSVCTQVVSQAGQCPAVICTTGTMKANPGNVAVTTLTCDRTAQWIDAQMAVYTAAQCEASCIQCTALSNTGMTCPTGFICEAATRREAQCSETFCATGTLTGNTARTPLTVLTCNAMSQWIDAQSTSYTIAQCEIPCDKCTALTNTGMTCPTGFVCTQVVSQAGQCPAVICTTGSMKANPGNVAVTTLTCDGSAQWIDAQMAVYTAAQCEAPCTQCMALSNSGMLCPKGFICEAAIRREAQCSETYCPSGTLTGNADRTSLTVLTCNAMSQWLDAQSTSYTSAQCEIPCNQCSALTNAGMTCLPGFKCTTVSTRNDGQCPEAYCESGLMTAGAGRTTVTSLTCNGQQQWVDTQMTVYSIAQCETSCTCSTLTITPSPNRVPPTRGNDLGPLDASGCSTLATRCSMNDLYRLVTSNGVVTLQPPAARSTAMTCVAGQWMATINGVQTTVQEQACYVFPCTTCGNVNTGPGVTTTLNYDATTWCKGYTLSGCPNGYKIGTTTIGTTLTCTGALRWSSGSFSGPIAGQVTVNCV
ncbi:hypothetical protein RB195_004484 [Necator americanus]|uniref:Uncharacterized protein n=1 Tax=Necator americanus TaxID=51031 RepID=A0ABR1BI65_NECAM